MVLRLRHAESESTRCTGTSAATGRGRESNELVNEVVEVRELLKVSVNW